MKKRLEELKVGEVFEWQGLKCRRTKGGSTRTSDATLVRVSVGDSPFVVFMPVVWQVEVEDDRTLLRRDVVAAMSRRWYEDKDRHGLVLMARSLGICVEEL